MRSTGLRWLVGSLAFLLPALVAFVGQHLDRSQYRHDPVYGSLIPIVCWGAIILAVVVPTALVLTARGSLPRRIGFVAAIGGLLLVEFYLIFISVLSWGC